MKYEVKEFTIKRIREILSTNTDVIPDETTRITFEGKEYTTVFNIVKDKENILPTL